jgi:uncharacterized membrane protein YqjE
MDIRTLESLQKAIPIVIRHLDSYVELAERDLSHAKSMAASRLRLMTIVGVSGLFALWLACALVIALTWDGQYRVVAIAAMAGAFALLAALAATSLARRRDVPFAAVRREWCEDRALFRSILANGKKNGARDEDESTFQQVDEPEAVLGSRS